MTIQKYMIDDNSTIHNCPVDRDVPNLFGGIEKDFVGPIGDSWFALF